MITNSNQSINIEPAILLQMFRKMFEIRYFDEAAGNLYKQGLIKGGIHAYIGQEAIAVGVSAHLHNDDYITSTHRGHGHHIAKGADLNRLMAEVLGKATGYCAGRGGSMHVAAFDVGSLGAFPINASGLPSGIGAAISIQLLKKDNVVVSYFGEGAVAQGTFHETLNMAAVWNLPIVFVCENNQYAVSTPVEKTIALKGLAALASAYNIPGVDINGQDILEVYSSAGRAVSRARAGEGPSIIHAATYRFEGHYVGEPQVYRSKDEVQKARENMDPIVLFQTYLMENDIADELKLKTIEENTRQAVDEALKFAEESPEPLREEFGNYVYA